MSGAQQLILGFRVNDDEKFRIKIVSFDGRPVIVLEQGSARHSWTPTTARTVAIGLLEAADVATTPGAP